MRLRGNWKPAVPSLIVTFALFGGPVPAFAADTPPAESPETPRTIEEIAPVVARVSGHRIKDRCTGYHEVVAGRRFTVTGISSVAPALTFLLEKREADGGWTQIATYDRTPADGRASVTLQATPAGRRRLTIGMPVPGDQLVGVAHVLLDYVAPRWQRYADGGLRLSVPWYQQQYRLSCEAATLRMAHNYHDRGSISSDGQALRMIGVDRRARSGNRWGNPNRAFVGNPNGRMMKTGYGVHYGPVAAAATRYDSCRPAGKLLRPSRQTIARYLNDGYPVIVWGAHRGASGIRRVYWRAWDGRRVAAYSVEHTWVVIGFRGSLSNPTRFIVHDPSGRARRTISASDFWAFTRYFRTGVVVRG